MNEIIIDGVIGLDVTYKDIHEQLKNMDGDINVKLTSPGGLVFEGISIHNEFKAYSKGKVNFEIVALAASMGSYIPLSGDSIVVHDNAIYMIHNALTFTGGDHRSLRKTADRLEAMSAILANAYIKKTGKTKKQIIALMDEETYFYGNQIKNEGFADAVVAVDDEKDEAASVAMALKAIHDCDEAIKNEKEDEEKLAALLEKNVATMPSSSEKIANKSQGETVKEINTVKALRDEFPDLVATIEGEASDESAKAVTIATEKAIADERARMTALDDLTVAGCEEADVVIASAKKEGGSVADTAVAVLKAIQESGIKNTQTLENAFSDNGTEISTDNADLSANEKIEKQTDADAKAMLEGIK